MRKQPSFVFVGLAVAATALGTSCRREASQTEAARTTTEQGSTTAPPARDVAERDAALVRAVNVVAAGPAADIYADDQMLFSNLEYKTVTPYKEIRDNEVTFKLGTAGSPTADSAPQEQEMLMDGRHYTVVALPNADASKPASLKVMADEIVPPDTGKVKVRVVNATTSPNDMEMMVTGKTDPVITDVGSSDVASYKEIDPVAGKLTFRDDKQKTIVAEVPVTLEAGKLYTVFVVGKRGAAGKGEAMMVQDELTPGASAPLGSSGTVPETAASPKY